MNYYEHAKGESNWEQKKHRFTGTALEHARPLNPEHYMHLLEGCAYDPGEIVGTPAFTSLLLRQENFRMDLEAHLARVDVVYVPCMNRDCLETNNADENIMLTIEGELTLCMLREEVEPIIRRLSSDAFSEICALSPEAQRPELKAWIQKSFDQAESYFNGVHWDDADEE